MSHVASIMAAGGTDDIRALGIGLDVDDGGGTVIQTARVPAQHTLAAHAHPKAHQSVLVSGKARVWQDGAAETFEGFHVLTIAAGVEHVIEAITDVIWLCVWATPDADNAGLEAGIKKG